MISKKILIFIFLIILTTLVTSCVNCSRSGRSKLRNTDKNHQTQNTNRERTTDKKGTISNLPSLFKKLQKSVFTIYGIDNQGDLIQGSGFVIDKSGICISNYHVFEKLKEVKIKMYDNSIYDVIEVLSYSKQDDLDFIIFKINSEKPLKSLQISETKPLIGMDVFTIGSPRGLENTLSKGVVSQIRDNKYIQIDASIDHGSSGGPLLNMQGEVIGITTAGYEGSALNFAIAMDQIPLNSLKKKILK